MHPTPLDFEADAHHEATKTDLTKFQQMAGRQARVLAEIEHYEAKLADAKARLKALEEVEMVEAFDACGLAEITLADGTKLGIKQIVAGSIPEKNRVEAFVWLRAHGHADLIKHVISVSLPKGKDKLGQDAVQKLRALGLHVDDKESVHAQTLGAWARERIAQGEIIPLDLLGIYVGRRATVIK